MPLYEYECTQCGNRTELLQRHGDPPLERCPQCGSAVRKLFSAPAVQFKGTGWYVTDYAGKGKRAGAGNGQSGDKESKSASGDGGSSDKKSESKSAGSRE